MAWELKRPLVPYLDTNIIIDYLQNRKPNHLRILDKVKEKKIHCYTCYFAILELVDFELEHKWVWRYIEEGRSIEEILRDRNRRELNEGDLKGVNHILEREFFKPFVDTNLITILTPEVKSWDYILKLLETMNISMQDAFHVHAAQDPKAKCNLFISNDSYLDKLLNDLSIIKATSSKKSELDQAISELGTDNPFD